MVKSASKQLIRSQFTLLYSLEYVLAIIYGTHFLLKTTFCLRTVYYFLSAYHNDLYK